MMVYSFLKDEVVRRLVDRLGELAPAVMRDIEDQFVRAFILGLDAEPSIDVCLSLLWRAHRISIDCSVAELVDELAPDLSTWRRREIANRLEYRRADILATVSEALANEPGSVVDRSAPSLVWSSDAYFGAILREVVLLLPETHPLAS